VADKMQSLSISIIFERGKDGKYTNNALLYHYILKYPILVGDHSADEIQDVKMDTQVSLRDMIKWLINTLPEFRSKYSNDNISNTVSVLRRRIKGKLDDLVHLELLLSEKIKQDKGSGTTDKYRFTIFGQLLGWIINSVDFDNSSVNATINRREVINKQIFILLQQIFRTGAYSPTIDLLVASNFLSKCKQLNLFGNIVNLLKNALNNKEILIDDISDLLHNLTTCNFKEQNSKVIFTSLWDETIRELEPKIKNVILYNLKLAFERDVQDHVKAYQSYEKMWFKYKSDNRVVTVECGCTNCVYRTSAVIDVMQYKERKFYSKIDWKNLTPLSLKIYNNRSFANYYPSELSASCQACGKGSLRLSFPD
jgi:hypothetical protein